ncbi:hypothetical protein GG851_26875 [Bordetella petrii]|nr:hypothetical protein [Bordetella petrii]
MWDFSLRRSLTLIAQTMSFIVLRCLVYFGIVLAYVLATGIGAGIGWGVGELGDEGFRMAATLWGGGAGFVLTAGVQQLMGVVRAFLRLAVGLVDEVILAYIIKTDSDNPWASARTGLVLYGQNAPRMMKNAAWLTLLSYGVGGLIFLALLAPTTALLYALPGAWSAGGVGFALLLAWALKAAVIEPFAIACLLQVYFQSIKGQKPDPEWEARLASASDKFGKLKDKAARFNEQPAHAPHAPPVRG